jgi:hypothetical protein
LPMLEPGAPEVNWYTRQSARFILLRFADEFDQGVHATPTGRRGLHTSRDLEGRMLPE